MITKSYNGKIFKIEINDEGDKVIYNDITERWIINSFANRRSIFKQIKALDDKIDEGPVYSASIKTIVERETK
tara:strand:- start:304 stop:522 length:219 start_codon:yes stop_codon:yes gene_type:complete